MQAARKAADVYGARQTNMREPYWGGTLDASCEDKEGAYAALQGFLAMYEATREPQYLQWAEHALDVVLTYVCVWDMDLPAGRLRNHGFTTRGWTAVSVQNMHIDAYGVLMTPDIYRLGVLTGQEELKQLALVMYRSCGQIIDPYGSQGEQPQHSNYGQGGDLSNPAHYRGGYNETWTVFWITAHFLNAAAQLQEMGVSSCCGMNHKALQQLMADNVRTNPKTCTSSCGCHREISRRDLLRWTTAGTVALGLPTWSAMAGPFEEGDFEKLVPADKKLSS